MGWDVGRGGGNNMTLFELELKPIKETKLGTTQALFVP